MIESYIKLSPLVQETTRRGDLTEGFLRYDFRGAYTWRGLFSEFLRYSPICHT